MITPPKNISTFYCQGRISPKLSFKLLFRTYTCRCECLMPIFFQKLAVPQLKLCLSKRRKQVQPSQWRFQPTCWVHSTKRQGKSMTGSEGNDQEGSLSRLPRQSSHPGGGLGGVKVHFIYKTKSGYLGCS